MACGCGCNTSCACGGLPPRGQRSEIHAENAGAAALWSAKLARRQRGQARTTWVPDPVGRPSDVQPERPARLDTVGRTLREPAYPGKTLSWRAQARELCQMRITPAAVIQEVVGAKAANPYAPGGRPVLTTDGVCECAPLPMTVDLRTQSPDRLGGVCVVSLGQNWQYGTMSARVPPCYEPTTSSADMLEFFLPQWSNRLRLTDSEVYSRVNDPEDQVAGLFWKQDYYRYAVMWALRTLHAYADSLDVEYNDIAAKCDITVDELRSAITNPRIMWPVDLNPNVEGIGLGCGRDAASIRVTGGRGADEELLRGQVVASRTWAGVGLAWNTTRRVHLCEGWRVEAALADYYLWWAHRLHSWALDGDGSLWDIWMGMMCARAAIAEVVEIAAIILHEWSHTTRNTWGHCHSVLGRGFNCCMYGLEFTFRAYAWSALGLPHGHLYQYRQNDKRGDFYGTDTPSNRTWSVDLRAPSTTSCAGMVSRSSKCSYFDLEAEVAYRATWPEDCSFYNTHGVSGEINRGDGTC